ncbi:MAG: hypothetical protein A3J52_01020 [Omnitrophica bacterium RIFCSPHIGHO2_02_FULL_49_9]|nr:MAG: hypothetical protein A3J52_01020 [Omnitrophica bacterium RIFCSPHIGHO2_02_FULL_49_9]
MLKGLLFRQNGVALHVLRKAPGTRSRLGIVVPKRVAKLASERNYFKRLVREFFRIHEKDFEVPCDMVIRRIGAKKHIEHREFGQVVGRLLAEAQIMAWTEKAEESG